MLLREAGKRENVWFCQCFPYYFLTEHIPVVVFQTGRCGRENGEGEDQQKTVYSVRDVLGQQLPVVSGQEAHL